MYRNYSLDSRKSLLFVIGSSSFIFFLFQEFFRGELEKLKKKKVFTAVFFQLKVYHLPCVNQCLSPYLKREGFITVL
jgi:hypothetical protein